MSEMDGDVAPRVIEWGLFQRDLADQARAQGKGFNARDAQANAHAGNQGAWQGELSRSS